MIFYVGSIFLLVVILPWNSKELGVSPYVAALETMGISWAADANAIVLTAVLSCLNSGLHRLADALRARHPPGGARRAAQRHRRGGRAAILLSTVVGYLCVVAAYVAPETVFLFLLNSSGAIILFVYLLIGVSQLVMRPKIPPAQLRVKMWFYPYLTLFTIAAMIAVLVSMGIKNTRSPVPQPARLRCRACRIPLSRRLIGPAVVTLPTAAVAGFLHGPSLRPWQAPAPRRWWPRASSSSPTRPWGQTSCSPSCAS